MLSNQVRSATQSTVDTIVHFLHKCNVTPNALTLTGCALVMTVGIMVVYGYFYLAAFATIFFAGFDALDGSLARLTGTTTKFGGFLDSTTDRYAELALFIGIAHYLINQQYPPLPIIYLVLFAVGGSMLVPYCRARAEGLGFECKGGLFSRFERLVVIVLTFFFTGVFGDCALVYGMVIIAVFTNITAIQRILHVYREDQRLSSKKQTEHASSSSTTQQ